MKKISIKVANKEDIDKILKIQQLAQEEILPISTINSEIENNNFLYLLAKIDNEPIGYLASSYVCDTMDILSILVNPEYRKIGVATELLEYLLQFCNTKNIDNILLEVRKSNSIAINLYTKFKFKLISIRRKYYGDEDALIYKLELK